jgi:hypothetical protein
MPKVTSPLKEQSLEGYGLNRTDVPPDEITALRDVWVKSYTQGKPVYFLTDEGNMFYLSVDGVGHAITLHPVQVKYEIDEGYTEYTGPDAWQQLDADFSQFSVVPMEQVSGSSIEGHVAMTANPIWLKAVQNIVRQHQSLHSNPYRKN